MDEVGRGALAGPVCVGLTAFRSVPCTIPEGIRDSKLLTPLQRQKIAPLIEEWVDYWTVASSSAQEIDKYGISQALGIAARRAIREWKKSVELCESGQLKQIKQIKAGVVVILDGPIDYLTPALIKESDSKFPFSINVQPVVKGDLHCASVAAASIVAKVHRDLFMEELSADPRYKPYQWDKNKGYGTRAHREAIKNNGSSDFHRRSWRLTKD